MLKRILFLPTVFFLVLAVSLWTAPAALAQKTVQTPLNPKVIKQFVDPLPFPLHTIVDGGAPITLTMQEFQYKMLPTAFYTALAAPYNGGTYVWGYREAGQTTIPSYIGPVIVATRDAATEIKFVNNLGTTLSTNVLAWKQSTDQTMHWADPLRFDANLCAEQSVPKIPRANPGTAGGTYCAENYGWDPTAGPQGTGAWTPAPIPAVVHLHGGEVPPVLDGGPDAWVTSDGVYSGHGYYTKIGCYGAIGADKASCLAAGGKWFGAQGEAAPGNYFVYRYPNTQEAAPIWFHDHVLGITRLNVYAGLAGAYVVRDLTITPPASGGSCTPGTTPCLPNDLGDVTKIIPLVIQDRMFDTNGRLFFPADLYAGLVWIPNPEHPYWVPEFVGDTIVVNGKTWPFLQVGQNKYRFLFLNGSNARTYELFMVNPATGLNMTMYVIGTDGGYLDAPAAINKLVIMPGERYDVIIDFSTIPVNTNLVLQNTGRTPYPKGAPPNGATVGRIMQFRVVGNPTPGVTPVTYNPAAAGATIRGGTGQPAAIVRLPGTPGGPALPATPGPGQNVQLTRQLTLNEVLLPPVTLGAVAYPGGPFEILLNNTKWTGKRSDGTAVPGGQLHQDKVPSGTQHDYYYTENPIEGETELWEIINLTADAHPIHLHLVQFQIVNRQNFNVNTYNKAYAAAFTNPTSLIDPLTGNPYLPGVFMPAEGPPRLYDNTDNPDFCPLPAGCTTPPTTVGGNPNVNLYLQGPVQLPALQETGWKDTAISYPGQVLRLAVRWAPTDKAIGDPAIAANQLWFPFDPNGGHGYVWHCHIIDHEDNEMMRPTSVTPNPAFPVGQARAYTNY